MLSEMRSSMGKGMFDGGYAGKMFQDMLDESMADQMSLSGNLGIADIVESQLAPPSGDSIDRPSSVDSIAPLSSEFSSQKALRIGAVGAYRASANRLRISPVVAPIRSDYGKRIHPVTGKRSFHEGIDLAAIKGSDVQVAGPGVVVRAGAAGTYGNIVVVDHGGGLETRYAHLESISVHVGQQLASGEILGKVGDTGRVTGPHLHFEVRRGGKAVDPKREIAGLGKSDQNTKDLGDSVDR